MMSSTITFHLQQMWEFLRCFTWKSLVDFFIMNGALFAADFSARILIEKSADLQWILRHHALPPY